MRKKLLYLLIFIAPIVQAQYNQNQILIGQSGQNLIDSLVFSYKPDVILGYDEARDTLFSKVYTFQDSVRCVYTGHQLYLNPSVDPSTALYSGGIGNGINTEHTYPQSKGASIGNARSDMHHLFPVRAAANSARNNFPYGAIDDNDVTTWYYLTLSESNPTYDLENYSKLDLYEPAFEPRNTHKGNAARAMFYFYTMYKSEADAADPTFFAKQVATLCQWHLDDPVDSLEWERNLIIATYQENKVNPFILDCSLPYRTYCPHLPQNSCFTGNLTLADFGVELYQNYPNPANIETLIQYELARTTKVTLILYNTTGQVLHVVPKKEQTAGLYQENLQCSSLPNGIYMYRLVLEQGGKMLNVVKKITVLH
ncbi:endonuclease [Aureispira anguillae]|uniref:Endonuclease n=1 Tax=Aureispira anguillae TaxID=2864201 RepID=A0A915YFF4_9BACT|nr:endonuclease [Aureispira anguillae]BDS12133.1 endonuclease [Aureispira anguillae]